MLINILDHLFKTKVECNVVSSDGYSPENLISASWRERNQGFLASHFIKPPVHILLQLPFPINIKSIVIKPKVGSQISCGIDIFVAGVAPSVGGMLTLIRKQKRKRNCQPSGQDQGHVQLTSTSSSSGLQAEPVVKRARYKIPEKLNSMCSEVKNSDKCTYQSIKNIKDEIRSDNTTPLPKYLTDITTDSFKTEHNHLFSLVCRANEPNGRTIIIVNNRFQERPPTCIQGSCEESHGGSTHEMKFYHAHTLSYVTHVVVCITRVKGGSVPAIGKLEIWGQVSAACESDIVNHAMEIQKKILYRGQAAIRNYSEPKTETKTLGNGNILEGYSMQEKAEPEIPADFLDPITCTLMMIPMLLPSGINVDAATLDKHIEAERQWGRLPSDPFTGLLFSDNYKPVPNGTLKVRVDKFILTSGFDVRGKGRTVGRENIGKSSARLPNPGNVINSGDKLVQLAVPNSKPEGFIVTEKKSIEATETMVIKVADEQKVGRKAATHEEMLSHSLDTALKETLQGLSFARKTSLKDTQRRKLSLSSPGSNVSSLVTVTGSSDQQLTTAMDESRSNRMNASEIARRTPRHKIPSICVSCSSTLGKVPAFQMPCQHLLCRVCLTGKTRTPNGCTCSLCGDKFNHRDVLRVHAM